LRVKLIFRPHLTQSALNFECLASSKSRLNAASVKKSTSSVRKWNPPGPVWKLPPERDIARAGNNCVMRNKSGNSAPAIKRSISVACSLWWTDKTVLHTLPAPHFEMRHFSSKMYTREIKKHGACKIQWHSAGRDNGLKTQRRCQTRVFDGRRRCTYM